MKWGPVHPAAPSTLMVWQLLVWRTSRTSLPCRRCVPSMYVRVQSVVECHLCTKSPISVDRFRIMGYNQIGHQVKEKHKSAFSPSTSTTHLTTTLKRGHPGSEDFACCQQIWVTTLSACGLGQIHPGTHRVLKASKLYRVPHYIYCTTIQLLQKKPYSCSR